MMCTEAPTTSARKKVYHGLSWNMSGTAELLGVKLVMDGTTIPDKHEAKGVGEPS